MESATKHDQALPRGYTGMLFPTSLVPFPTIVTEESPIITGTALMDISYNPRVGLHR